MSGRYNDKGSSRSGRDDSRPRENRHRRDKDRRKSRSRSRSPKRRDDPGKSERSYRSHDRDDKHNAVSKRRSSSSDEEVPAPPPPPRITKISIGFQKPGPPIKMTLGATNKAKVAPKPTVASVFNSDDDDEPEEMPAEAKMRMRNIGRETPTSAGPNSFGKTKQGFCDSKKVFEKNLKQALDTADKPTVGQKFPQTIYRINGP